MPKEATCNFLFVFFFLALGIYFVVVFCKNITCLTCCEVTRRNVLSNSTCHFDGHVIFSVLLVCVCGMGGSVL